MKSILFLLICFSGNVYGQTEVHGLPAAVYDSLTRKLVFIGDEDQKYRNQIEETASKFGGESKEMKSLFNKMRETDSMNLVAVSAIIDQFGWLGPGTIGDEANKTLFLVIQHADLKEQDKYLPVMRNAVKDGNAKASELALLEDRVALRQGRKQIYGSQISWNMKTNTYYVLNLEDPDNVDKRRAQVGLEPLAAYTMNGFHLSWSPEQYKKDMLAAQKDSVVVQGDTVAGQTPGLRHPGL
jgi:hypothetical protein